ncbi:HesB/YadR/YfhF family protein [Bacillus sp. FJAT-45350]|uniref:HesB/YadR/YfhF family protein n=1 Tax=Bacillus sp. FJAT-45350 TaxID=2011014 RepID=UPI00211BAE54|nr:HesB/YadR/YfhF family protein [Bacillus sp. FJAT-45350]
MVTEEAKKWFFNEFNLKKGNEIRIFVRYGGCGSFQQGFSLGIMKETSSEKEVESVIEGVSFYITREDLWYFDGVNLTINYDETKEEIEFLHEQ